MLTFTVSSDCYLENPDLGLERAIKDRLTIDNPKYIAALRYGRWIGKKLKPQIRGAQFNAHHSPSPFSALSSCTSGKVRSIPAICS